MTQITREWLLSKNFNNINNSDRYTLSIGNIPGVYLAIEVQLSKSEAKYQVNNTPASKAMKTQEEIERLYEALTGNKL